MFSSHRFCVAPMIDCTDRHARYFLRLLSRHARLYTEMVTTGALLHGDAHRHLHCHPQEAPVALQLGGSDPKALAHACQIAETYPYDEINLNVGCPSDRVQSGLFGACLMQQPRLVADCIQAMRESTDKMVTVKCRIGIDQQDSLDFLKAFIEPVAGAGCQLFILHARSAWLQGLSPRENREIPPLNYQRVHEIKSLYPELQVIINGGITTLDQCEVHLQALDGVMLGREAYHNPYILAQVDKRLFGDMHPIPSRSDVIQAFLPYIEEQMAAGARLHHMTRHVLGLFNDQKGARAFRRHLSTHANRPGASIGVLLDAMALVKNTP